MTIEQAKQTITNSTLPADIKAQALENLAAYPNSNLQFASSLSDILRGFRGLSPQYTSYWREIRYRAEKGEFDPPAEMPKIYKACYVACYVACDEEKVKSGQCDCVNAMQNFKHAESESVEDKPTNSNTQYIPTCIITGRRDNLTMHAQRNDNGDMTGWMFVHESIQFENIDIQVNFTTNK